LDVTMGTLTTNMNSLEDKGYIVRERSKADKRVVLVVLTPKGKKAFYHHRGFHRDMIKAIVKGLDEDEMKVMIKCLLNLNEFFEQYAPGQF
ncbi:MAG: MarR family winged helix-turn-helix transcriptional regulator, partial [Lachnospiraceae bacterium]|nr:MarR family winged helix-turn-helix transcriptional regulator [Lachnospiraceae bacterium]